MSDTVIKVENLSKRYIIGRQRQERYTTLRDSITNSTKSFIGKFRRESQVDLAYEDFWALKDINFEVKQGDRVGIIGRNGAGKSTLLKILSRITEPTNGAIRIKGRVASLLEVGTGFHPELTGRENIFLNGAILGMEKTEIQRKFDEIVDFAEVEKFLDTPVKRYSSGMYVRLAFAVAAHLEPEILIVDEVLAVGDAQFQKKCLGKMEEVTEQEGRTILFVSHNMSTIQALCSRCLLLKAGEVIADNNSAAVVQRYLQDNSATDSFARDRQPNGRPTIVSGKVRSCPETKDTKLQVNLEFDTELEYDVALTLRLFDAIQSPIGSGDLGECDPRQLIKLSPGLTQFAFSFSIDRLAIGGYFISLDLTHPFVEFYDRVETCLFFEVLRPPENGNFAIMSQSWNFGSVIFPIEVMT